MLVVSWSQFGYRQFVGDTKYIVATWSAERQQDIPGYEGDSPRIINNSQTRKAKEIKINKL